MLKGIDPLLNADILYTLASMGHGDSIVLCDANFPAATVAAKTNCTKPIHLNVDLLSALQAVLSVFPIDTYDLDNPPAKAMQVVDAPDELPEVMAEVMPLIVTKGTSIAYIERSAFYEVAGEAFAVIRTNETRPYGNLILRKGVV